MSAAATLFQEELRKSQARGDTRADAVALNAVIRAHGVPRAVFGPPNVAVGHSAGGRAELCVLGLHRHFLSAASYTVHAFWSFALFQPRRLSRSMLIERYSCHPRAC